jgi:hypothetical protein
MTTVLLLTLGITAIVMSGMAVGVVVGRKELKGSCGGVGGACACENAGKPGGCKDGKGPPGNGGDPGEQLVSVGRGSA